VGYRDAKPSIWSVRFVLRSGIRASRGAGSDELLWCHCAKSATRLFFDPPNGIEEGEKQVLRVICDNILSFHGIENNLAIDFFSSVYYICIVQSIHHFIGTENYVNKH